jgi:hypothetical protein
MANGNHNAQTPPHEQGKTPEIIFSRPRFDVRELQLSKQLLKPHKAKPVGGNSQEIDIVPNC